MCANTYQHIQMYPTQNNISEHTQSSQTISMYEHIHGVAIAEPASLPRRVHVLGRKVYPECPAS